MSDLRIEYMDLDALLERRVADNPKAHDVDGIALSIRRRAFNSPPTVDEASGRLVAGHGRLDALVQLRGAGGELPGNLKLGPGGAWMVPVVRGVSFDGDDAFYEYLLSDNALAIARGWEDDRLAPIVRRLMDAQVPLEDLGHEAADISALLRSLNDNAAPPDTRPPDPAKWGAALGCTWDVTGRDGVAHRLRCGDSRDVEQVRALFAGRRARWMWTDPPYGVDYVGKTSARLTIENDGDSGLDDLLARSFETADQVLADGSPIYVAAPPGATKVLFGVAFMGAGWRLHQFLVWSKDRMVLGHSDYHYQHEDVLYGWKGKNRRWYGGRDKVSVIPCDRPAASEEHPTMKPVELVEAMLANSAKVGDLGYEPFGGSGSTMLAADRLGCPCYAMEIDPGYCSVILDRMVAAGATVAPALSKKCLEVP